MDSRPEMINLGKMISEIIATQKKVYMIKSADRFNYGETDYQWVEKIYSNLRRPTGNAPEIKNFKPLVYFISEHIITNSMKAAYLAATVQKTCERPFSSSKYYSNIGAILEPKLTVSLSETADGGITAIFTDNGIGMPREMLRRLFSPKSRKTLFRGFTLSNGSSMKLFPYIMDLTGITLHAQSKVGAGTTITLTIPKETAFN
jgi:hypothetical protein